jgi:hypothetical protein
MGLKLLVLIVIIAAVWYGFKLVARRNRNVGGRRPPGRIGPGGHEASDSAAQDMESCTVCGTFVPNASAKNCGRDNCPYPG